MTLCRACGSQARQVLLILLFTLIGSGQALAARFPDAVEKEVVLTGASANTVAKLFGLSHAGRVSLPLGRMDAWAVYLLKKDTKTELLNDNDGSPPRVDVLEFSNAPAPSLTIEPFWLDLSTQHPSPLAGSYSFGSPFISNALDQADPWTQLLKRLKKEQEWKDSDRIQFQRSFPFSSGGSLTIRVFASEDYANNKHGHSVTVMVHPNGS